MRDHLTRLLFLAVFVASGIFVLMDGIEGNPRLPGWFEEYQFVLLGIVGLVFFLALLSLHAWFHVPDRRYPFWLTVWLYLACGLLNVGASYAYFMLKQAGLAAGLLVNQEACLLAIIYLMWPRSRLSAWLMAPFAVWVAYAAYLALGYWQRSG